MAGMSPARTTSTSPTAMPDWAIPVEDLEAMLATDDDTVDTAAIPRLAYREAVEESAGTSDEAVTSVVDETRPESAEQLEHATPPVGHSLRRRHASPESVAAIRRNLVAVACVIVSVVLLGAAITWFAGWIAVAAYAVLVIAASVTVRRANARYAPRHSRYTPRHG